MRNLSYENEFSMQFHFYANQSHFHKNAFTLRLALKKRHKGTWKWPVIIWLCLTMTGTYQIHEFDWLKSILTGVKIFPFGPTSRLVVFCSEKVAN